MTGRRLKEETVMTKTLKTIVIGTSLTGTSDGVVRTGIALARTTGASLWLIHAYTPHFGAAEMGMDAVWMEEQAANLRELIAEQVQRTGLPELPGFLPTQVNLVLGAPHREIVDLAQSVQADLVIVGAAESTHGLLGSTAERVIRKAPCPVLVVRSETAFPPTRVEIPVDLSPISADAFRQGLGFLAQAGAPLAGTEALFVLNPLEVAGSFQFTPDQIERFAAEELQRFLAANGGGSTKARVRSGFPREEILTTLAERQADLAVLGTHGRGGFERLMLGSIAAGVLRAATCNLLIVPPAAARLHGAPMERTMESTMESQATPAGGDWSYVSDESPAALARS
jgi:universal stress protein E